MSESKKIESTAELLEELEGVELQYENIVKALPRDCFEINPAVEGLHMIAPTNQHHPMLVKCIGSWTIVQRRYDGSVDFNRTWDEYSRSFGEANGEFWIGNEMLHELTSDNCTKLRIIMQDIDNRTWHVDYDNFSIGSRDEGYPIQISDYSGNASNALDYQNNMKFSAPDMDSDISTSHCARIYEAGW